EELNRVLTDHVAGLLLCASQTAMENLRAESAAGRAVLVGDVMVDVAMRRAEAARGDTRALRARGLEPGAYLLLTAHRPANVDPTERLRALVDLIRALPLPVLFPVHPRTRARLVASDLLAQLESAS